jgi:hypothetical protein
MNRKMESVFHASGTCRQVIDLARSIKQPFLHFLKAIVVHFSFVRCLFQVFHRPNLFHCPISSRFPDLNTLLFILDTTY